MCWEGCRLAQAIQDHFLFGGEITLLSKSFLCIYFCTLTVSFIVRKYDNNVSITQTDLVLPVLLKEELDNISV